MHQILEKIHQTALEEVQKAATSVQLKEVEVKYLGRKGELTNILKGLKDLSDEEKRVMGPKTNAVKYLDLNFFACSLCSRSRNGMWIKPARYKPKKMMMMPPMRESHCWTSYATLVSTVFSSTPKAANTAENPKTKKKLVANVSQRCAFSSDVPARYAKNPGISGSTHGARNETSPATNATARVTVVIYPTTLAISLS